MIEEAHTLARQYAGTSLYQALHAELQALATEANGKDVSDPYEITKLRGVVETCTRLASVGFLIQVAQRAILMQEAGVVDTPKPPANPPMDPNDWWAVDLVN